MSVRLIVRTFSELCITVGALIVLFVVYVLFWTGVKAADATEGQIDTLQNQWARGAVSAPAPGASPAPGTSPTPSAQPAPAAYRDGKPFAMLYIPRFGKGWEWPVLENTEVRTLQKGLGHYRGTARLGATGNFAVAGHRRTYGDPFKDFPKLRPGDAVLLTDGTTWFTYRIDKKPYRTVPSDIGVIDPVPRKSGFDGPGRYLTLTTCDPEWGSSHRLIAWAHLDATQPVSDGRPAAFHS
ncbi:MULTISPECIES: class E sortase [unclassified Streptomyces]|uniref:class E sortase n=1 Tax=unclassified Streptomyces TaxID=2593676 RepID=UPI0022526AB6|nr:MULTISPECIES: class E sortase [unclassified Streptomyces]WSP56220.1 class E sortase [Streptomyces sp. NBC_01241]WSU23081.1 class E sortase [Streptomyces sp. NBC_01108]MCX4787930.1 class E sortase [Streptomyces sp. NBC_01221]MCX4796308.1 class E sortase [Streptomyces sp. NBC_01242]WSJ37549.1 class E sortase [Streptomyces sp. NBC_01321]